MCRPVCSLRGCPPPFSLPAARKERFYTSNVDLRVTESPASGYTIISAHVIKDMNSAPSSVIIHDVCSVRCRLFRGSVRLSLSDEDGNKRPCTTR